MEKKNASPAIRDKTGRFVPGISGNISGRPKRTKEQREALEQIRELAQETPGVLAKLLHSKDTAPALKLRCVEILLDRTYGKPQQSFSAELSAVLDFENVVTMVDEEGGSMYVKMTDDQVAAYQAWLAENNGDDFSIKIRGIDNDD